MSKTATRVQLQTLADKINTYFHAEPGYGAKVNDRWFDDRLIIGWEEGPYEWVHEEALIEMAPKGWFVEPVNHWAVAMYRI